MKAYRIDRTDEGPRGRLVDIPLDQLDQGEVVVRVLYSGINYKDALAGTGQAPIIRRYPCVGGIEAVGEVVDSDSEAFRPGDLVIAHGRGLGVSHDGGFAEFLRAPADWLVALPGGLTPREAATLGVAGHSAALAVDRIENLGVTPEQGPIAVTGATGGVGILAIGMLARRGFRVTAVSGKADAEDFLRSHGATEVLRPPGEPGGKPLEAALWAGAVDAAGGPVLEWLLRTAANGAVVTSIGNAAGITLHTTVLPFILRGVSLVGINADSPPPLRRRIWSRLATDLKPDGLAELAEEIPIESLPGVLGSMIAGRTKGRTLVAFPG